MAMYDQRAYSRGGHFDGQVLVSTDGDTWAPADVSDISSGGLKLHSNAEYGEGEALWFDICLQSFLSEFEIKTMGVVCRKAPAGGAFQYGIAFKGLSRDKQIQIDENVRNDRPVTGKGYEAD